MKFTETTYFLGYTSAIEHKINLFFYLLFYPFSIDYTRTQDNI